MSGGYWDYRGRALREAGADTARMFDFVAELEEALDWALSGDTCRRCCRLNLFDAIEAFFDGKPIETVSKLLALDSCPDDCKPTKTETT